MSKNFEGKQLIDSQCITSGTEYFYAVNRASGEEPGSHFFNASVADIDMAAAAAKRRFHQSIHIS
jgi:acyl-CoA reductase-like NAD-dependent aldehyde dehydrogenase